MIHDADEDVRFSDFKRVDKEFSEASFYLIQQWYGHYGDCFLESEVAQLALSEEAIAEFPFILSSFCDFCYHYHLQKPGQWTEKAVKEVCGHIMPRKVTANTAFFTSLSPALTHFLGWMSHENYLPDTQNLQKALLSLESTIVQNANDPHSWGIAKSLMMGAQSKGYDIHNPRAIEAALARETVDALLAEHPCASRPAKQENEIATLEDILEDLRYLTEGFPRAAVEAALLRQAEITPILLTFLEDALLEYEELDDNDVGHLYALYLLAYFREKAAFPLIIKIASLPDDWPEFLLSDTITESLHRIMGSVYDGNIKLLQELIENKNANTWSRNAALRALLVLVKAHQIERDWVIHYFKQLFDHPSFVHDEEGMAITHLTSVASDLYPAELCEEIERAFARDQVDTQHLDMKWINSVVSLGKEAALVKYLYKGHYHDLINDVAEEMQWWACFQADEPPSPRRYGEDDYIGFANDSEASLPYYRESAKIGRNAPCSCGSGKKYKKCCLH